MLLYLEYTQFYRKVVFAPSDWFGNLVIFAIFVLYEFNDGNYLIVLYDVLGVIVIIETYFYFVCVGLRPDLHIDVLVESWFAFIRLLAKTHLLVRFYVHELRVQFERLRYVFVA
jgi:hypothetical protein